MMPRTTHMAWPNNRVAPLASTTPMTTPRLRSIPFARDRLTLGCTTRRAAMAAKMGNGWFSSTTQTTHAPTEASDVLSTCNSGLREDARKELVSRIAPG